MDLRPLLAVAGLCLATGCAEWRHWPRSERAEPMGSEASVDAEVAVVEAPEVISGDRVLGAKLVDPSGTCIANIADLLVDPGTGRAVAAVVVLDDSGGEARREPLAFEALDWRLDDEEIHAVLAYDDAVALALERSNDPFDGRELARIEGEIIEVKPASASTALVKVRDDQNLLHRVRIGAADLVRRRGIALEPGRSIAIEGVQTRDEKGKLWIACSLTQEDTNVQLRDAFGNIQWDAVAGSLVFASGLGQLSFSGPDGAVVAVEDWRVDRRDGAVLTYARIEGEDQEIAWEEILRTVAR